MRHTLADRRGIVMHFVSCSQLRPFPPVLWIGSRFCTQRLRQFMLCTDLLRRPGRAEWPFGYTRIAASRRTEAGVENG